jgi:hypothetical protein
VGAAATGQGRCPEGAGGAAETGLVTVELAVILVILAIGVRSAARTTEGKQKNGKR